MTVHYQQGNLFDGPEQTKTVTVNTDGVMGKGIALECKKRYPDVYEHYRWLCQKGHLTIETLKVFEITPSEQILLFPTKIHWRNPSRVEWIDHNLQQLATSYNALGIDSIAVPLLGSLNGELDFVHQVKPLIHNTFDNHPLNLTIYYFG